MIGILFTSKKMFEIVKKDNLKCRDSEVYIISAMSVVCLIINLIYLLYVRRYEYIIVAICFSWLLLLAYIDKMSGYVYEVMEYYGVIIAIGAVIELIVYNRENAMAKMIILLILAVLSYLAGKMNIFGMGDADVLAVVFLVLSDFYIIIMFYSVTVFLFIIRYIRLLIYNKGKIKGGEPLIPSIYMAYVLFILFYCI